MAKRKSYKKEFYKTYKNFFESYEQFSQKWNEVLYKKTMHYFGGRNTKLKNKLNRNFGSTTNFLLREEILKDKYKTKSFLNLYENYEGTELEKYEYAEKTIYQERLENFLEKYGDEIVDFDDENNPISLNEKMLDYLSGEISQDDMNFFVDEIKNSTAYTQTETYNKTSQNNISSSGFHK